MSTGSKYVYPFLFAIISIIGIHAQDNPDDENVLDYQKEVARMINIPNTPEASSFTKYGDLDVGLYRGVPNISIPLHTINGREMNLPISLTYDATGIKVEQLAQWTGMSWNLNVGGRISRIVNGLADDYAKGKYKTIWDSEVWSKIHLYKNKQDYIFDNVADAEAYFQFLGDTNDNLIDTRPDVFSVSAPGLNATISITTDPIVGLIFKVLDNPRIKVSNYWTDYFFDGVVKQAITSWEVINEDGTKYLFSDLETTKVQNIDIGVSGIINNDYHSSWLLTKILSPNGKDVFEFNYTTFTDVAQPNYASSASLTRTTILPQITYYAQPTAEYFSASNVWLDQQYLASIKHNGVELVNLTLGTRADYSIDSALDKLVIKNQSQNVIKEIDFDYTYFGNASSSNSDEKRLKLDAVKIKGSGSTIFESYSFEYNNPDQVPSRASMAQDFLGYYNGADSNSVLYTEYINAGLTFVGANREPSTTHSQIGLLKKITYPLGGYTLFDYESHEEYKSSSTDSFLNHVYLSLDAASPTKPELYTDDNDYICDDRYSDDSLFPKIVISTFSVPKDGNYIFDYDSSGDSKVYLADYRTGQTNYNDYCDFENEIDPANSPILFVSEGSKRVTHFLPQGKHRVLLLLDDQNGSYGSTTFQVLEPITISNSFNEKVGGHRIAKIIDFSEDGEKALEKSYDYTDDMGKSTGTVSYKPVIAYKISPPVGKDKLVRTVSFPKGDQPYVTYNSVRETKTSVLDGTDNGYTRYDFYKGSKGNRPRTEFPYDNNYYGSLKVGNLKNQRNISKLDSLVSKKEIEYFQTSHFMSEGLTVYQDEMLSNKRAAIKQLNSNQVIVDFLERGNSTDAACSNPANGYIKCILEPQSALKKHKNFINANVGGISTEINTTYFHSNSNTDSIAQITRNTYAPSVDYLIRNSSSLTSKKDSISTSFYYPKDAVVNGASDLVDENKLTEVMKTVVEEFEVANGNSKSKITRETEFSRVNSNAVLPAKINWAKGNETPESRINFAYSDTITANLSSSQLTDGMNTLYVWGYNNKYPVAKIENATTTQLNNVGLDLTLLNSVNSTDSDKIDELEKIRVGLPNAMVHTYTYAPHIGVTSITDPRGYTIYYSYDSFNRLKDVKDADGNLVTDYQYHSKTQQ